MNLSKGLEMLFYGINGISLFEKRDYSRRISETKLPSVEERWRELGLRMRKAADKVVGQ